jgi:hypothetical protein
MLNRPDLRRLFVACLLLAAIALSAPAAAVPIPWKNCGTPGDLLSIQQYDASVWPPSVAAPVNATATFDASGQLHNLRVFLILGVAWTFDSGPLPTSASGGFVPLPASFPVSVSSPPLPLAAGPYSTTHIFGANTATPVTVISKGTLAAQLDPPLVTNVSLSFDGTPGFPLSSAAGDVYDVRVQMTESSGPEVFCLDLTIPFKTAAPLVKVVSPSAVPLLSPADLALLALLVAACGLLAARNAAQHAT